MLQPTHKYQIKSVQSHKLMHGGLLYNIYIYNMGFEVCGLLALLVLFLRREARGNYIITVSQSQI